MKFPTKAVLRAARISNSHDVAMTLPEQRCWISYTPNTYGRGGRGAHVHVVGIGHSTDRKAHWEDYGCKTFVVRGAGKFDDIKKAAIQKAKVWAAKGYGRRRWIQDPFGGWHDEGVLPRVLAAVRNYKTSNGDQ